MVTRSTGTTLLSSGVSKLRWRVKNIAATIKP
jgi:hypothetical protein